MKSNIKALVAAAGVAAFAFSPAEAFEAGYAGTASKAGGLIGASAGVPPPGIYMFNQVFTFQSNLTGPGVNAALGGNTRVGAQSAYDYQGFLFVPGWTFLGGTYDAVIVQPFGQSSLGASLAAPAAQFSGVHNTYIVPVELSWKLGTSGFVVKSGLGIWTPDGTIQGPTGLSNQGAPFWTFQPELIVSYLKDGWNLSVALYEEINTANSISHYTSGDIFHADFTATKTFGKWTLGPVAYYYGQVTNDSCAAACLPFTKVIPGLGPTGTLLNTQRFNVWALGGLVEYNFGPASLSVWATQEISAKASNPAALTTLGSDFSLIPKGSTVLATLSYRLIGFDEPAAKAPMFHK
ncbi:MAG TPA: transporter [Bradyrhizobium sp.]|nr:transporter [Bradyrhizobium sp.]